MLSIEIFYNRIQKILKKNQVIPSFAKLFNNKKNSIIAHDYLKLTSLQAYNTL